MENFKDFYTNKFLINKVSKGIAESNQPGYLAEFVSKLNNSNAKAIFEAWYNPMDWMRGAGRYAATRFMAEPEIQHIEELFNSLSDVIQKSGRYPDFEKLLVAMDHQIQNLKSTPDAKTTEAEPADPAEDPSASTSVADDSSKDPHSTPKIDRAAAIARARRKLGPSVAPTRPGEYVDPRTGGYPAVGSPTLPRDARRREMSPGLGTRRRPVKRRGGYPY